MFTGIVEAVGRIKDIRHEGENIHFVIEAPFTAELQIDQSVAHDGCCLTVVALDGDVYTVTAVRETLDKTVLSQWKTGGTVNLERCMQLGGRLDGHIVQGHVDQTATLVSKEDQTGSYFLTFEYEAGDFSTVEKGSITVNGVSLTVVDSAKGRFSVAVIPYTWDHTNLSELEVGDGVNIEFDIIGKYISNYLKNIYADR